MTVSETHLWKPHWLHQVDFTGNWPSSSSKMEFEVPAASTCPQGHGLVLGSGWDLIVLKVFSNLVDSMLHKGSG